MQMCYWFKTYVKNHIHWLRQEVCLKFFTDAEKRQRRHQCSLFFHSTKY